MSSVSTICKQGGAGWFLPITEKEQDMDDNVRAIIYGAVMVYMFLGVSIIADIFMSAIEAIANRKQQTCQKNGRYVTTKIWNETVATLSLMALGSSAPEIFLSVMEHFKKEFHFGALGPSTIVGSATFNLLVIIGVCVFSIPSDEVRQIKDLPTFYVTAFFSVVAYVWLCIILVQSSEDIVEVWEAVVTLLLFALLLYVSYCVDVGRFQFFFNRFLGAAEGDEDDAAKPAISFTSECSSVEGRADEQEYEVTARLSDKGFGTCSCAWRTETLTAVPGYDYAQSEGKLEFTEGVMEQNIRLTVLPKGGWTAACKFLVVLDEAEGAKFDPDDDGGAESAIHTVTIERSTSRPSLQALDGFFSFNKLRSSTKSWRDKFWEAIYCNGSYEEQQEASCQDWCYHILALPWKIVFVSVPPTGYGGSWVCFYCALFWIAFLSAFLSDLAEMFGCVLKVPEIVTAITFVALGTSMPDLFASLSAARDDPWADASIVNVTGSNSVNVFLGLGVPWTIGSIYWEINGRTPEWEAKYPRMKDRIEGAAFICDSTNLGFSVMVFIVACVASLGILYFRRKVVGGELGGVFHIKLVTTVCFLFYWAGFVASVSWRSLRYGKYDTNESLLVIGGILLFECCCTAIVFVMLFLFWWKTRHKKPKIEDSASEKLDTGFDALAPQNGFAGEKNGDCDDAGMYVPTKESGEPPAVPITPPASMLSKIPADGNGHVVISTNGEGNGTHKPYLQQQSSWTVEDETTISVSMRSRVIASLGNGNRDESAITP